MAIRTIEGTIDTFSVNSGSEVTYLGATSSGNPGEAVRAFRVNPGGTGNIIVKLDKTSGVNTMQIFQEDSYGGSSAASGYKVFTNIAKDGKGKGAVGTAVVNAAKDYVVMLTLDGYSEVSYNGSVDVP